MTAEFYSYALLMWLTDRTSRDTYQLVNIDEFADVEHLPVQQSEEAKRLLEEAARLLERSGFVTLTVTFGPTIHARLTWGGLRAADEIAAKRRSRAARLDHVLGELVNSADEDPTGTVRLDEFIATAVFLGEHMEIDEVLRAAQYLHDHGLATVTTGAGHQPEALILTSRGIDCALSGKRVRQFVSEQNTPAVGPVFNQYNSNGGTGAQGMHVVQHVGVQPAQLADLIRQLREVAPQLELDEAQRDSFIEDIEILDDSSQDTQVRLSAGQRLRTALAEGGTRVGTAAVLAGLDRIVAMITG
ncbi:hypothetical protein [Streptomyces sp. CC219B]|uniref:hypothetical protein n=1 Tax=Streptomyces sp. CC219B TaxID=3044574 RepID=UPI0024A7B0E1|nr:hypothetical protein [Streptomyces sp. CC219B]